MPTYGRISSSAKLVLILAVSLLITGVWLAWFSGRTAMATSSECSPSSTNLAIGRPVLASTSDGRFPASNVVDGNLDSWWMSQGSDPQWIYVDLGQLHQIQQIVLRWSRQIYGESYRIEFSDDAVNWSIASFQEARNGGVDIIPVSGSARYIRMFGLTRGHSGYGYSIGEFEVYDHSECEVPSPQEKPPAPVPGPQTLFFDDFEDGADPAWRFISGTWNVNNGGLETETPCVSGIKHTAIVGDSSWTNYEVQFDFRGVKGSVKQFTFRYEGPASTESYVWQARSLEDDIQVHGGGFPAPLVPAVIQQGIWYRVRIRVEGEHIQVYLDDQLVIDRTDIGSQRLSGGVGPFLNSGDINCPFGVQYDNILVTAIPANQPPIVSAVGPYSVDEGNSIVVTANGSDPDNDPLTYSWDLDDDGIYETSGQSVTFSAANLDGPSSHTITAQAIDSGGLSASDRATVNVFNVAPTVQEITAPLDPVQVNTSFNISANFSDPGTMDSHTAVLDWDDSSTSVGTVNETNGSGTVTGSHTYSTPGVYTVKLTVTDDDGDSGHSIFQYIVVYDPDGGFVTGGGWIDSPPGACCEDPTLTGKANFGFISKYRKGASTPTGNTEFQFHAADLNFHSDSYEWLVVSGAKAKYKGEGTLNGVDGYKFMLTAIDADINENDAFGIDRFRIKIWTEDQSGVENIVYDNALGSDDDMTTTEIGGGSITIHEKK